MAKYLSLSYNGKDGLHFTSPFAKFQSQSVTLRNDWNHCVAFKLKTTSPHLFYCAPYCGFLAAGGAAAVEIGIKTRRANEIIASAPDNAHAFMLFAYPLRRSQRQCDPVPNVDYSPADNPLSFWCRPVLSRLLQATKLPVGVALATDHDHYAVPNRNTASYVRYASDSDTADCPPVVNIASGDCGRQSHTLQYRELGSLHHAPSESQQCGEIKAGFDSPPVAVAHGEHAVHCCDVRTPDDELYASISPVRVVVERPSDDTKDDCADDARAVGVHFGHGVDGRLADNRSRLYRKHGEQSTACDGGDFEHKVIEALKRVDGAPVAALALRKPRHKAAGPDNQRLQTAAARTPLQLSLRSSSEPSPKSNGDNVCYESTTTTHITYTETTEQGGATSPVDRAVCRFGDTQRDLDALSHRSSIDGRSRIVPATGGDCASRTLLTPRSGHAHVAVPVWAEEKDRCVDECDGRK